MKKKITTALAAAALPIMLFAQQPAADDPFAAMLQLQREMDAAMARFHEQMMKEQGFNDFMQLHTTMPKVDLRSVGDHYELTMNIPGASEKGIDIHTENHIVTVSARQEEVKDVNESNYYRHERRVSDYIRSIQVPDDADTDHMKTEYKNGVLTITMPKRKK